MGMYLSQKDSVEVEGQSCTCQSGIHQPINRLRLWINIPSIRRKGQKAKNRHLVQSTFIELLRSQHSAQCW